MKRLLLLTLAFTFFILTGCTGTKESTSLNSYDKSYDVIVVGGGTGGVAAAIQAAHLGSKVALIEETDWLGGQMTAAGVPNIDEGYLLGEDYGIFKEFITRVKKYYGEKPINVCYWGAYTRCFEPHVGRKILEEMVAEEKNITLLYRTRVDKVLVEEKKITGVETSSRVSENDLLRLQTNILIDATEYGDIIALSGASYRVGKKTSENIDTTACTQTITYTAVVRKYFNGVPPELVMDKENPPGGWDDYNKMKAVFHRSVRKDGNGWSVDGKSVFPYNYKFPYNWSFATGFRAVPDSAPEAKNYAADWKNPSFVESISKTIINMANDYPVTVKYLEDREERRKTNCAAKIRTLQYIYYLQYELGESQWSIANDEGYDTPYNLEENSCPEITGKLKAFEKYMPVMPYVRESRRMQGVTELISADLTLNENKLVMKNQPSALTVGDYFPDLHLCRSKADLEPNDNAADLSDTRRIFQIPFGVFVSKDIFGLMAAEKNISVSRIVSGATRLQPVTMYTGQSAGMIAGLAVRLKVSPKNVNPIDIQTEASKAGMRFVLRKFDDVDTQEYPFIQSVISHEIMTVDNNKFRPEQLVTRADWAVMASKIADLPYPETNTTSGKYSDVGENDPAAAYIAQAMQFGLIQKCSTGANKFCPNDPVTRADIAWTLFKIFKNKGAALEEFLPVLDAPSEEQSQLAIQFALQNNLMNYCDADKKLFCPNQSVNRLSVAEILAPALKID